MIIYKKQESGQATDFQHAKKCPDGWQQIDGDKFPDDLTPYHEQKYIDSQALENQHSEAIRLLDESEKKVSSDPAQPDDVPEWKTYRAKLRAIVRSDTLQTIPAKPF